MFHLLSAIEQDELRELKIREVSNIFNDCRAAAKFISEKKGCSYQDILVDLEKNGSLFYNFENAMFGVFAMKTGRTVVFTA